MKNIKITDHLLTLLMLFFFQFCEAQVQWDQNDPGNGDVIYLLPNGSGGTVTSVGIGDFSATNPSSYLDVDETLSPLTNSGTNFLQHIFRTNGVASTDSYWEMFVAGSKKFHILNYNTDDISLGTIQAGNLHFFTNGGSNPRMTVLGAGNVGYVGIGVTTPTSVLHVDGNGTLASTGQVFRTDGPSGDNQWRMYSSNVSSSEKFNITNYSGSSNVGLGTIQAARLHLFTNGSF